MNKKGFTLIELLSVIVLMSIIFTIGSVGITSVKKIINNSMWESNITLIETAAEKFGEDNRTILNSACTVDGKTKYSAKEVTVQNLIDRGYIKTKEVSVQNKEKVLIDYTKTKYETDSENYEEGYYVNNKKVCIYIDDNSVYAKYLGLSS